MHAYESNAKAKENRNIASQAIEKNVYLTLGRRKHR
jgi:hypothetical protein